MVNKKSDVVAIKLLRATASYYIFFHAYAIYYFDCNQKRYLTSWDGGLIALGITAGLDGTGIPGPIET